MDPTPRSEPRPPALPVLLAAGGRAEAEEASGWAATEIALPAPALDEAEASAIAPRRRGGPPAAVAFAPCGPECHWARPLAAAPDFVWCRRFGAPRGIGVHATMCHQFSPRADPAAGGEAPGPSR